MPIVDQDTLHVVRTKREQGDLNLEVEFDWTDSTGANKGRFTVSFPDYPSLKVFLEEQGFDDLARNLMGLCIDRTDGTFRRAFFNGMGGKTFRITSKAVEVL